jgi:predicted HicB family RNase H-like nuclease
MAKDETAAATDNKKSVTVRLDPEVHAAIEKLALEDERSVSQYVERHLRKSFKPTSAPIEGYGFTGDKPKTIG